MPYPVEVDMATKVPGCTECGERESIRPSSPGQYGSCGGCNEHAVFVAIASCACEDSDTLICAVCAQRIGEEG